MQLVVAPVHTPEQVREIITEAILIADEYDKDSGVWRPVFEQSCRLLGARGATWAQPQPIELDLRTLRSGG